jgi:hypothetical protein
MPRQLVPILNGVLSAPHEGTDRVSVQHFCWSGTIKRTESRTFWGPKTFLLINQNRSSCRVNPTPLDPQLLDRPVNFLIHVEDGHIINSDSARQL